MKGYPRPHILSRRRACFCFEAKMLSFALLAVFTKVAHVKSRSTRLDKGRIYGGEVDWPQTDIHPRRPISLRRKHGGRRPPSVLPHQICVPKKSGVSTLHAHREIGYTIYGELLFILLLLSYSLPLTGGKEKGGSRKKCGHTLSSPYLNELFRKRNATDDHPTNHLAIAGA